MEVEEHRGWTEAGEDTYPLAPDLSLGFNLRARRGPLSRLRMSTVAILSQSEIHHLNQVLQTEVLQTWTAMSQRRKGGRSTSQRSADNRANGHIWQSYRKATASTWT